MTKDLQLLAFSPHVGDHPSIQDMTALTGFFLSIPSISHSGENSEQRKFIQVRHSMINLFPGAKWYSPHKIK